MVCICPLFVHAQIMDLSTICPRICPLFFHFCLSTICPQTTVCPPFICGQIIYPQFVHKPPFVHYLFVDKSCIGTHHSRIHLSTICPLLYSSYYFVHNLSTPIFFRKIYIYIYEKKNVPIPSHYDVQNSNTQLFITFTVIFGTCCTSLVSSCLSVPGSSWEAVYRYPPS